MKLKRLFMCCRGSGSFSIFSPVISFGGLGTDQGLPSDVKSHYAYSYVITNYTKLDKTKRGLSRINNALGLYFRVSGSCWINIYLFSSVHQPQ